jgi:flagellar FliL protein
MAKKDKPQDSDEVQVSSEEADGAAPKKGFLGRILGSKKMLLIVGGGALALLLALGGGAYFFFFSGSSKPADAQTAEAPPIPLVPPQVAFYDMPDVVVNIQSADGTPAYLKLGVSLELVSAEERSGLQVLKPRIVDQFQAYLRELRVDDLKGSAGVLRLKEELLRRVNVAAAPYPVKDVLLKEMIVQ